MFWKLKQEFRPGFPDVFEKGPFGKSPFLGLRFCESCKYHIQSDIKAKPKFISNYSVSRAAFNKVSKVALTGVQVGSRRGETTYTYIYIYIHTYIHVCINDCKSKPLGL